MALNHVGRSRIYTDEKYIDASNVVSVLGKAYAKHCANVNDIDFLIVRNNRICPVEVKSSNYSRHRSFDVFFTKYKVKCPDRYIIYAKDFKKEDGVTYLPIYMTMCL